MRSTQILLFAVACMALLLHAVLTGGPAPWVCFLFGAATAACALVALALVLEQRRRRRRAALRKARATFVRGVQEIDKATSPPHIWRL